MRTIVTPASTSVVSSVEMKLLGPRPILSWSWLNATRGVVSLSFRSAVTASAAAVRDVVGLVGDVAVGLHAVEARLVPAAEDAGVRALFVVRATPRTRCRATRR